MATLFRPEPSRSWWNAHGEDVCLAIAITCAVAAVGTLAATWFWTR